MPTPTRRHGLAAARRIAVELTPQAVEQIASRVAQLLHHQPPTQTASPAANAGWMTAKELAQHLKLNPAWVYEHANELGAIRTGNGPKARIRFDLHTATQALKQHQRQTTPAPATPPRRTPSRAPRPTPPTRRCCRSATHTPAASAAASAGLPAPIPAADSGSADGTPGHRRITAKTPETADSTSVCASASTANARPSPARARACDCGCGGGWNKRTAAIELENMLARVKAEVWTPPRPRPRESTCRTPACRAFTSTARSGCRPR